MNSYPPHKKLQPSHKRREEGKKLAISRARYHLIPVLQDLFAKKSFSGHKIDQLLRENHLSKEDRGLFTELFYGFLRYGHQLLYLVDKFLAKPEKMPQTAKWILAIAFYQKLYLHKIPDHALANDAVEMTKRFVGIDAIVSAVNAILRKFLANYERFENLEDEPLWVQTSFPKWLSDYLSDMWSPIKFFHIAESLNSRSPTYIRVNVTKISEEKLILKLAQENINCVQTGLPYCLLLPDLSVSPKDVPGYHEGLWTIQNMASQRIVRCLDLAEGHHVLDACAGFGGKTLQMSELFRDKIFVDYHDIVEKKSAAVATRAQKMGFKHVKPVSNFEKKYDRILIDAPCSGLGTISSHPEIKWFRDQADLAQQYKKQKEVLTHYSQFLKNDGKLLYAVCSIDKNEGEKVIADFLNENKNFILDQTFQLAFEKSDFGYYLMPTEKGESGYFISRLLSVAS